MNSRSLITLILSLAGGALDFTSGSLFLMAAPGLFSWTVGLYVFGGAVVLTGILGITSIGMRWVETFGGLMLAYGAIMMVIGWLMYPIPMMVGATLSSIGMFAVGILMIASGTLMSLKPRMEMHEMQSRRSIRPMVFIASLVVVGLLGFGLGSYYAQAGGGQGATTMAGNSQYSGSPMSEELSLSKFDFTNTTVVKVTILNTGTSPLTITKLLFNMNDVTPSRYTSCIANLTISADVPLTMPMDSQTECRLSFAVSGVRTGLDYPVRIVTASGTQFVFSLTAGATNLGM